MNKLRVLALMHKHLVPPDDVTGFDVTEVEWKMEFDVAETLRSISAAVHYNYQPCYGKHVCWLT